MFLQLSSTHPSLILNGTLTTKSITLLKENLRSLFILASIAHGLVPKGPLPGAYLVEGLGAPSASSFQAPPPTQSFGQLPKDGPSHFRGAPKKTKGKLDFLAHGLFACFNISRQNAKECEKHMNWQAQKFLTAKM
jgi:hypothetical protein